MVLGFDDLGQYLTCPEKYLGAVVGPVCNRIGNAEFSVGAAHYKVTANNGKNCLHSNALLVERLWDVARQESNSITLETTMEDGEAGFPGPIKFECTYSLDSSKLVIRLHAHPLSKPVPIAMTTHPFFNLSRGTPMCKARMQIFSSQFV